MSEEPRHDPGASAVGSSGGAPGGSTPSEPFEKVMERLAKVVSELESGELPLEQALVLFEEGVRLSREGASRLDRAEARVEELLGKQLRAVDPRELRAETSGGKSGRARPSGDSD
jgi:exodeoxyribonuclease VII small subunit